MTDVFENILNQLNRLGETVVDKSGFYFKKAVDKGEELSRIGKLQFEIEKARRDLKNKYLRLGEYIYQQNEISPEEVLQSDDYRQFLEDIKTIQNLIEEKEQEKKDIKVPSEEELELTEEQ
ncbi:MAG: hypothetical protein GXO91_05165 [FCB group bacterium]|nr:hypothetical protein [FCB group bacterium]